MMLRLFFLHILVDIRNLVRRCGLLRGIIVYPGTFLAFLLSSLLLVTLLRKACCRNLLFCLLSRHSCLILFLLRCFSLYLALRFTATFLRLRRCGFLNRCCLWGSLRLCLRRRSIFLLLCLRRLVYLFRTPSFFGWLVRTGILGVLFCLLVKDSINKIVLLHFLEPFDIELRSKRTEPVRIHFFQIENVVHKILIKILSGMKRAIPLKIPLITRIEKLHAEFQSTQR